MVRPERQPVTRCNRPHSRGPPTRPGKTVGGGCGGQPLIRVGWLSRERRWQRRSAVRRSPGSRRRTRLPRFFPVSSHTTNPLRNDARAACLRTRVPLACPEVADRKPRSEPASIASTPPSWCWVNWAPDISAIRGTMDQEKSFCICTCRREIAARLQDPSRRPSTGAAGIRRKPAVRYILAGQRSVGSRSTALVALSTCSVR